MSNLEKAATTLQAYWRGRQSRLAHKLPQNNDPNEYAVSISGNEPPIALAKQAQNNFVFVGCSGLKNFNILLPMISLDQVDFKNGYKGIPKLYIVDFSEAVYQFWIIIKKCFQTSGSLAALLARLAPHQPFFKEYCNDHTTLTPGEYIEQLINSFAATFSSNQTTKNDIKSDIFWFLKLLVEKATILRTEWEDSRAFEYIRDHHSAMPIHVYASNIVEFRGHYHMEREAETVLNNIALLTPQSVIHTRTDASHSQCDYLAPEHVVILDQGNVEINRTALTSSTFKPLVRPATSSGSGSSHVGGMRIVSIRVSGNMTQQEVMNLLFVGALQDIFDNVDAQPARGMRCT